MTDEGALFPQQMVYYISGPMTGIEEFNYPFFNKVAKLLRQSGLDIVSPAETEESLGYEQGSQTWHWGQWMRYALQTLLLKANAIIMLPGWETSRGALLELEVAEACNMQVFKLVQEGIDIDMKEVYAIVPFKRGASVKSV